MIKLSLTQAEIKRDRNLIRKFFETERSILPKIEEKPFYNDNYEYRKTWDSFTDNFIEPIDNFIGQELIKEAIEVAIISSIKNQKALPHMLFYGPPGFGKTEMANTIIKVMNVPVKYYTGETISNHKQITDIMNFVQDNPLFAIVFIDEIHRIAPRIAEELFEPMERFKYKGQPLQQFTMLGATTNLGKIIKPLRDRFRYLFHSDKYSDEDLIKILKRIDSTLSDESVIFLVTRCKGTPRLLVKYYEMAKNVAVYDDCQTPTEDHCRYAMHLACVDDRGLDESDICYLKYLYESTKPIGRLTLAAALNIPESDIVEVIEPYLLQQQFIEMTPSGRVISDLGAAYIHNKNRKATEQHG